MGSDEQFMISFSGLAVGTYDYSYRIGDAFFEGVEDSEIGHGDITVNVTMDRQERMLAFNIRFEGCVTVPCDRCLDPLQLSLAGEEVQYVKFGDDFREESIDVVVIPRTEHRYDLKPLLYEMILLSLPYQRIHPDDEEGNTTCDPEVIARLESLSSGKNDDSRWDVLKTLKPEEN